VDVTRGAAGIKHHGHPVHVRLHSALRQPGLLKSIGGQLLGGWAIPVVGRLTVMDQFVKQDTCVVDVVQVPGSDQENLVPLGIVETSQTPALEASGRATPGVGFPFADQKNVRRVVAACPRAVVVE